MSLEGLVEEVVVPDIHNVWKLYLGVGELLIQSPKVKRVVLVGDLRNQIDYDVVKAFVEKSAEKISSLGNIEAVQNDLKKIVDSRYAGNVSKLVEDVKAGSADAAVVAIVKKHSGLMAAMKQVNIEAFLAEAKGDYEMHERYIGELRKKHPAEWVYVDGNHDTVLSRKFITSATCLLAEQVLKEQGIVGAFGCHPENGGELNESFNGPNLAFCPEVDDDLESIEKSSFYQTYKDESIDLIVTHNGGDWGESRVYKGRKIAACVGITQLGLDAKKKNRKIVVYEGHLHDPFIGYADSDNTIFVVRPGVQHIAKVYREGDRVKKVEMYEVN